MSVPFDQASARARILAILAEIRAVPVQDVAADVPLTDYGIASVEGSALCASIEDTFGVRCDLDVLYEATTVDGLVAWLPQAPRL